AWGGVLVCHAGARSRFTVPKVPGIARYRPVTVVRCRAVKAARESVARERERGDRWTIYCDGVALGARCAAIVRDCQRDGVAATGGVCVAYRRAARCRR